MVLLRRHWTVLNIAFAFFLLVAQVVSIVYLPFDFVELLLKLFVASFCVMFIMNELETSKILRDSPLLWNWVPRGVSLKSENMHVMVSSPLMFLRLYPRADVILTSKRNDAYEIFRHFSYIVKFFHRSISTLSLELSRSRKTTLNQEMRQNTPLQP